MERGVERRRLGKLGVGRIERRREWQQRFVGRQLRRKLGEQLGGNDEQLRRRLRLGVRRIEQRSDR
jgi:hypothetical protein